MELTLSTSVDFPATAALLGLAPTPAEEIQRRESMQRWLEGIQRLANSLADNYRFMPNIQVTQEGSAIPTVTEMEPQQEGLQMEEVAVPQPSPTTNQPTHLEALLTRDIFHHMVDIRNVFSPGKEGLCQKVRFAVNLRSLSHAFHHVDVEYDIRRLVATATRLQRMQFVVSLLSGTIIKVPFQFSGE